MQLKLHPRRGLLNRTTLRVGKDMQNSWNWDRNDVSCSVDRDLRNVLQTMHLQARGGPRGLRPRLNHRPVRCIPSLDYSSRAVVVVVYLVCFVFVYVIVFSCICLDSRRAQGELITTSSRQCEHCGGVNHTQMWTTQMHPGVHQNTSKHITRLKKLK